MASVGGEVPAEEVAVMEQYARTIQEQESRILELQMQLDAGAVHGLSIQAGEGEEEIEKGENQHNENMARLDQEMIAIMEQLAEQEKDVDAMNTTISEDQYKQLEGEYAKLQAQHASLIQQLEKASFGGPFGCCGPPRAKHGASHLGQLPHHRQAAKL